MSCAADLVDPHQTDHLASGSANRPIRAPGHSVQRDWRSYGHDLTAEIGKAFRKELSQFVSCSVTLNGEVAAGEELTGKACAGLKERPEAKIDADFPCGVFVLF